MKNRILGGSAIGIGGLFFVCSGTPITFTLGILMIVSLGLPLLTGYVPLSTYKKELSMREVMLIFLGNSVGAVAVGLVACWLPKNVDILAKVNSIMATKSTLSSESLIVSGAITGLLIGLGVIAFHKREGDILGILMLFGSVVAFVVMACDHVVANMFYLSISDSISLIAGLRIIFLSGLGNFIGGYSIGKLLDK